MSIDGTLINKGGDLSNAKKVSLIPRRYGLPRHDLAGIPFVRRFCRGAIDAPVTSKDAAIAGNEISRYAFENQLFKYSELHAAIHHSVCQKYSLPGDVVAKLIARLCKHYGDDSSRLVLMPVKHKAGGMKEYLHCIVAEACRFWVRSTDGAMLVTPPDYDQVYP